MNVRMQLLLLLAIFAVSGCVSTTVIPVSSSEKKSQTPTTTNVLVFMKEADVAKPFTVLGTIHHRDMGKFQRLDLNDVIPVLKDKARELGAIGIIIDKQETVYSGVISRGIDVGARAIKY